MGFEMDWSTLFAISDLSDTPWWQYMLGGAGITLALTFSARLLALVVGTLVGIIRFRTALLTLSAKPGSNSSVTSLSSCSCFSGSLWCRNSSRR